MSDSAGLLTMRDVVLRFSGSAAPVLGPISLELHPGEFLSLVGPSGCGKSTLLRLMAGLLSPTQGTIVSYQSGALHDHPSGLRTGFVFQHPTLLPWRTALQNLALPLELGRRVQGTASADVLDLRQQLALLQQVGLHESDGMKRPGELSGGMQMRLSLARALAVRPALLLLDEPLAAVDDLMRLRLQQDLLRIHHHQQLTSVLVTHNLDEAVFLGDRVVVLGGTPARIVADIQVTRRGPATDDFRASPDFRDALRRVSDALFQRPAEFS